MIIVNRYWLSLFSFWGSQISRIARSIFPFITFRFVIFLLSSYLYYNFSFVILLFQFPIYCVSEFITNYSWFECILNMYKPFSPPLSWLAAWLVADPEKNVVHFKQKGYIQLQFTRCEILFKTTLLKHLSVGLYNTIKNLNQFNDLWIINMKTKTSKKI